MTQPSTDIEEELLIIMGAVYAAGAIDKANNPAQKLDLNKIPEDSRVLNAVAALNRMMIETRIEELESLLPDTHLYYKSKGKSYSMLPSERIQALKMLTAMLEEK